MFTIRAFIVYISIYVGDHYFIFGIMSLPSTVNADIGAMGNVHYRGATTVSASFEQYGLSAPDVDKMNAAKDPRYANNHHLNRCSE